MTSPVVKVAMQLLPGIRVRQATIRADYASACADYRRDGFGPAYCLHGASLWVDYDIPCGCCETYGSDYLESPLSIALREARRRVAESNRRQSAAIDARVAGLPVDVDALLDWALEPLNLDWRG